MIDTLRLEQWTRAEQEREERIQDAWARYHGVWRGPGDRYGWPRPLRITGTDPQGGDNTLFNLAKLAVDKSVSVLFGVDLDFEVDAAAELPEEAWLRECLDANGRMALLHRLGVSGAVCGQAFLKLRQADPTIGHSFPRVILWDPACVAVRWDPADYERVISYTYRWQGVEPRTARPVAYRQRVEALDGGRWRIVDERSIGSSVRYEQVAEELWPWSWSPVLTCQNLPCPHEWWGQSDLEQDVLRVGEALNFTASNLARILRVHAHPRTWGAGFHGEQLDISVDRIAILPAGAELHNLEMTSDLSSTLEYLRLIREMHHELTRIPEVASGRLERTGQLSGVALRILYAPLIELTETKRLMYGGLLRELGRRLLEMGGYGPDRAVEPQWPEIVPADPAGEAQTALMHHQLGVSRDTLLSRLGFDPLVEAEKRTGEEQTERQAMADRLTMWERDGQGPRPGGAGDGGDG